MKHEALDGGSRRPRLPVAVSLMPAIPMVELPDGTAEVYQGGVSPCRRPGRVLRARGAHGCYGYAMEAVYREEVPMED